MNNYSSYKKGRDIVPSARKSIHSYKQERQPSASSLNMGVYGLNTHKNRGERLEPVQPAENEKAIEIGKDEVDNVQSKLKTRDHELIGRNIKQYERRKSFDINYFQEDSSDSNDVQCKSLPTSLPSYYHYSSCDQDLDDHSRSYNTSGNRSNQSVDFNHHLNQTPVNSQTHKRNRNDTSTNSVLWAPFVVVIIGVIVIYGKQMLRTTKNTVYDESKFYNDIDNLRGRYRLSQDSLLQVQTGISTISEREDTGSFIFVYNSQAINFNYKLFEDALDSISHSAAKFLRNDSTTVKHVVVKSSDLNMRTTSELINKYREDVTRTGVMLIKDIDGIPSSLAMAFHYYCDEYNPLVKKSAIFFTLDLVKCQYKSESSMHYLIEKCLANKWNSVPPENIKPLLTRVVDIVVDLSRV